MNVAVRRLCRSRVAVYPHQGTNLRQTEHHSRHHRLLSNMSRFNEVGKDSDCDRGDPKPMGLAISPFMAP
jgi:hypothetical protein